MVAVHQAQGGLGLALDGDAQQVAEQLLRVRGRLVGGAHQPAGLDDAEHALLGLLRRLAEGLAGWGDAEDDTCNEELHHGEGGGQVVFEARDGDLGDAQGRPDRDGQRAGDRADGEGVALFAVGQADLVFEEGPVGQDDGAVVHHLEEGCLHAQLFPGVFLEFRVGR